MVSASLNFKYNFLEYKLPIFGGEQALHVNMTRVRENCKMNKFQVI